jgi:outer membrane protein TolC
MIRANDEVERNSLNVALYAIRERINQLYFGVLVIDEQIKQLDLLRSLYDVSLDKVTKAKESGYSYQSDIDEVRAEILGLEQRKIEFSYARKGYIEMLSYWIGKPLPESTRLQSPSIPLQAELRRPELALYASQRKALETLLNQIKVGNRPKIGLLGAGVLIAPGINFGNATFSSVALAGISASWNTGNLYRSSNNRQLQKIQLDKIQTEEETFRFNNGVQQKQTSSEIEKQRAVIRKDEEIIALKTAIKKSYQLKYDNGISPMSDLITATNKEAEARSNQSIHEVQLLMSLYNLKTINGN